MKIGLKTKSNVERKCKLHKASCFKSMRSGFTLMEIMVVVVIIAVLASVAGPMIGDIVDQGRASATKSKLSSIKSALVTYKNDVGRYPYYGKRQCLYCIQAYCADKILAPNESNVLVSINCDIGYDNVNGYTWSEDSSICVDKLYGKGGRRWKGPYMDADPSDFMIDSWGTQIRYIAHNRNLYLWSAGQDGEFYEDSNGNPTETCLNSGAYEEGLSDDIIISVARFKKKFE